MNLLFLLDEQSDLMTPREAQQFAAVLVDTVCNPDKTRPARESVLAEALRQ